MVHAVVIIKCQIQDHELASKQVQPPTACTKYCVLEQDTLLSTGFYPGRPAHNTQKMRMLQLI